MAVWAALVQVVFITESHRDPVFRLPMVDAARYHREAVQPSDEAGQPYWQPPLYVWLLRGLYGVVPADATRAVRLVHGAIGVLTVLAAGWLARSILAPPGVLAVMLVLSLYGPLLFYSSQLLPTVPATLLILLALLATQRYAARPTRVRALLAGVAFGLAALAIPNSLVAVAIPLVLAWRQRRPAPAAVRAADAGLILAGLLLCILPVTIRNYAVSNQWVPISVNGGVNFYIGNNANSDVTRAIRPDQEWNRLLRTARDAGARTPAEADAWFMRRAVTYARAAPLGFLRNLGHKTLEMLNGYEAPRNMSLYVYRHHSPVLAALVWKLGPFAFPFGLLAPLALLGLVMGLRRPGMGIPAAFALLYGASVVAFFPADRYRLPLVPVLAVFAVAGVAILVQAWPDSRRRMTSLALLAGGLVVTNLPLAFPTDRVPFEAELDLYTGVGLQTRGHVREAVERYNAALDREPDMADAWYYLGTAQRALGHKAEARDAFRTCLAGSPDHERALHDLALLVAEQGNRPEAILMLEQVLELNPGHRRAMMNLGILQARQGNLEVAADWLRRANVIPAGTTLEPDPAREGAFRVRRPNDPLPLPPAPARKAVERIDGNR